MAKVRKIKVEPMTEESFRPFGQILDVKLDASGQPQSSPVDFQGGTTRIGTGLLPYKGLKFNQLEQHFALTQSFIPLGGSPAVIAVAEPTDPKDPNAIPKPEEVRVFLVDGTKGYLFYKGTWHSDRLPLYPPGTKMVTIGDAETGQDLRKYGSMRTPEKERGGWKLNRIVNYETRFGVTFEAVL